MLTRNCSPGHGALSDLNPGRLSKHTGYASRVQSVRENLQFIHQWWDFANFQTLHTLRTNATHPKAHVRLYYHGVTIPMRRWNHYEKDVKVTVGIPTTHYYYYHSHSC